MNLPMVLIGIGTNMSVVPIGNITNYLWQTVTVQIYQYGLPYNQFMLIKWCV